jgi:hypothetical protein
MIQTNIQLPEQMDGILATIAAKQGKKKEDVIFNAIEEYIEHTPVNGDVMEKRRRARGMWKDRTDLPDFDAIRRSMDRQLNWND